jgi:hypothetical protein
VLQRVEALRQPRGGGHRQPMAAGVAAADMHTMQRCRGWSCGCRATSSTLRVSGVECGLAVSTSQTTLKPHASKRRGGGKGEEGDGAGGAGDRGRSGCADWRCHGQLVFVFCWLIYFTWCV